MALVSLISLCSAAAADEFDFDWNNKNDMRGAWLMCATTGFTQGECPKVFERCWQPPMIYRKRHKIRTYCTGTPQLSMNEADSERVRQEAFRRAQDEAGDR